LRDEGALRLHQLEQLAVRGQFVAQRLAAARHGNRIDRAELQQAFLLLLDLGGGRFGGPIDVPVDWKQDQKQRGEDYGRTRTHAKNLLRTKTMVAIANRMNVSRPAPRSRKRCDCSAVTKNPAVSALFSRSRLAIRMSSPASALMALTARSRFPSISINSFDANAELPKPTIRVICWRGI